MKSFKKLTIAYLGVGIAYAALNFIFGASVSEFKFGIAAGLGNVVLDVILWPLMIEMNLQEYSSIFYAK